MERKDFISMKLIQSRKRYQKCVNQQNRNLNRMSDERCFKVKEMIWAKIKQEPWWPGKISDVLNQKNKKVYKVNFFGHPTYCHLLPGALVPFTLNPPDLDNHHVSDLKLKNAISLARNAFFKNQQTTQQEIDYKDYPCEANAHQPSASEETKIQSRQEIDIPQKSSVNESELQRETNTASFQKMIRLDVNEDSILDIMESKCIKALTKQKGYNQRKTAFDFKRKLEFHLLNKYNLFDLDQKNIPSEMQTQQHKQPTHNSTVLHQRKFIESRHHIRKSNHTTKGICIRKLYSYLRSRDIENQQAKILSINLVRRVQNLSGGISQNSAQFRKNYIGFIDRLKSRELEAEELRNGLSAIVHVQQLF